MRKFAIETRFCNLRVRPEWRPRIRRRFVSFFKMNGVSSCKKKVLNKGIWIRNWLIGFLFFFSRSTPYLVTSVTTGQTSVLQINPRRLFSWRDRPLSMRGCLTHISAIQDSPIWDKKTLRQKVLYLFIPMAQCSTRRGELRDINESSKKYHMSFSWLKELYRVSA